MKNNNIKTLSEFKDKHYGKVGTAERDQLDAGYEQFKLGVLIHEAQLAIKSGTTKSYISRIENNVKEVRLSKKKKIVELGLGGHLELSIKL